MLVAQQHTPFPGLGARPGYSAGLLRPALSRSKGSNDSLICAAVTRFGPTTVIPPTEPEAVVKASGGRAGGQPAKSGDPGFRSELEPQTGPTSGANILPLSPSSASAPTKFPTAPVSPLSTCNLIIRDYAILSSPPPARPAPSASSATPSGSATSPPTRPSPPAASPPMGSSLLHRRCSRSTGQRPNMSLTHKLDGFPTAIPLPLPLGQLGLDDTVRGEVVGRAAAADTPATEGFSPTQLPALGTPVEVPYLPTKKFVSTPYPEKKKGWLEEEDEDEDEFDSQKGAKYVASDEDSEGEEEEDDYFESEKQQMEQSIEALSLTSA